MNFTETLKMNILNRNSILSFVAGLSLGLATAQVARADDIEIFTGDASLASSITPNVLFIIDTSGSMRSEVRTQSTFDPSETYAGDCDASRIYWSEDSNDPPECDEADEWFAQAALRCQVAAGQLNQQGLSTLDYFAQYGEESSNNSWKQLDADDNDGLVECAADSGQHGNNAGDAEVYAADGDNGPWSTDAAQEVSWGNGNTDTRYVLYTGNYLNWTESAINQTSTRLEVVQDVTNDLLDNLTDVNVGLMRFSNNGGWGDAAAEGGQIIHAIEPVELGRAAMQAKINGLAPSGWTPLAESMYEAALYYRGERVDYGRNSRGNNRELLPSVAESRTGPGDDGGDFYLSPVPANALSCQKNFIVLLTDGEPTRDNSADAKVAALNPPSFESATGRTSCDGNGSGRCLDDVAEYLFEADLNDDSSDGRQNVVTYTIGFAIDLPILEETARRGGGEYFTANDAKSLENALLNIVTEILDDNTTFVAPTVSVNAFNRIQNLNDLFIAVFQANNTPLWNGNLKKYRMAGDQIVGADGTTPVVDPNTGFFADTSQSIWASRVDGAEVKIGGAANLLGDPASRNVYSNLQGDTNVSLADAANHLLEGNAALSDALLAIGAAGDPSRSDLLRFARGTDLFDDDRDGDVTDSRQFMGDPLHAKPVSIVYGGSAGSPDAEDAVVYLTTNEGYLHAVDAKSGQELFAFIPRQLLPKLKTWYTNDPSPFKGYGLDGDIRARIVDRNANGVVEAGAGDKVILYFGMRRGGNRYFAVDVTNRNAPKLLWTLDNSDLPGLGQTWSMPMAAKVDIQGATQNTDRAVLIFGGGYDASQDNVAYSTDTMGTGIYMVDADSGALLWRVGPDAAATLQMPAMNNSIPAGVRVLDMNSDGFADRMYVGDMGGRLWRFDIFNGQPATTLVRGGVMASLGAADVNTPSVDENRRFYNTPDVALIRRETGSYLSVSLGSGYRAHPLDNQTEDSFYSIRDYNPFRQLSAGDYAAIEADKVTHDDPRLADITGKAGKTAPTVPAGAAGWRLDMAPGEKVLAQSRTFQEKIFFTSYSPQSGGNAKSCVPQRGSNKLYIVGVEDGKPPYNLDKVGSDDELTIEDRAQNLAQSGIAPDVTFLFQTDPNADPEGINKVAGSCGTAAGVRPRCLVGLESCPADFCNAPVRTFWTQDEATEDQ